MVLYEKQVKYSLYEEVPAYGFNPDGYTDVLLEDTGWISESEDVWEDKCHGPFSDKVGNQDSSNERWTKREERYVEIEAEPVVHGYWMGICTDDMFCACSNCAHAVDMRGKRVKYERCPHCGAKMNHMVSLNGTPLTPSFHGKDCLGSGEHPDVARQCDHCNYFLMCFPECAKEMP